MRGDCAMYRVKTGYRRQNSMVNRTRERRIYEMDITSKESLGIVSTQQKINSTAVSLDGGK